MGVAVGGLSLRRPVVNFPITAHSTGRYVIDQSGAPFPIFGRASWGAMGLTLNQWKTYINDCVTRGFTAIELPVPAHDAANVSIAPQNGAGDLPFIKKLDGSNWAGQVSGYSNINIDAADVTTPNEVFWADVDAKVAYCFACGLVVLLFPFYFGFNGSSEGWRLEAVANGATKMATYGAFIGARYATQKNLIWLMGGDTGTTTNNMTAGEITVHSALWTALLGVTHTPAPLISAEWGRGSISGDQANFGPLATLNGAYAAATDVNNQCRRGYAAGLGPTFAIEMVYDSSANTTTVRGMQWWAMLNGGAGYATGNDSVWPFVNNTWQAHLNDAGTQQLTVLHRFFRSIAWYSLVPSALGGQITLVTAGGGTANTADEVACGAALDGSLLVAFIPTTHTGTVTIAMTAMRGTTSGTWVDPVNGATQTAGSGFANTSTRAFTTPGANSGGDNDWTLMLVA